MSLAPGQWVGLVLVLGALSPTVLLLPRIVGCLIAYIAVRREWAALESTVKAARADFDSAADFAAWQEEMA